MNKLILIFLWLPISVFSQKQSGVVHYEYRMDYLKIIDDLTFMNDVEKERIKLTWGSRMNDGEARQFDLFFNEDQSFYTHGEYKNSNSYYARNTDDFYYVNNFKEKTTLEYLNMLGKTYLIQDSLPKYKWKVLNELKEIQGHLCMKASTQDNIKGYEIQAWFAADIPISAGPENYYGLPGIILELNLNEGAVLIEATNIEFKEIEDKMVLPKKMKGKKINLTEKEDLIKNHIKDSNANKMNPYWSLRY